MIAAFFDNITAMIVLTGVLVALAAALPGTFLVLRGSAMLTDAISHAIVLGIVLVFLATGALSGPVQLAGAALAGLATVALSELLARTRLVAMDAAIGLVFPALFALGVLLINLFARDVHLDEHTVLLGEIGFVWLDTRPVMGAEVPVAVLSLGAVLALNAGFVALFWKELKLAVFDPALAAALGFAPALVIGALLTLTSVTAVAAFDAVGAILFIAFVIVPPATAALLTRRLGRMLALAMAAGVASALSGYALALRWDVSIGGMMAAMTGAFFVAALVFAPEQGLLAQALGRRSARADRDAAALVVHLGQHAAAGGAGAGGAAAADTIDALVTNLRWPEPRARAAVLRALDRGLVHRAGVRLRLTDKGAATARQLAQR
ncbi:MAG: metal ABC transporter permease [Rhodobacteraceae bacterium]|nr:metal ABC transporter permease [Paracoccaceae bacterium]